MRESQTRQRLLDLTTKTLDEIAADPQQETSCQHRLIWSIHAEKVEHDSTLGRERFATVIDVGANKGQCATDARLRWPRARLICFEPLPEPRAKLSRVTRGRADLHGCALAVAAGEAEMEVQAGSRLEAPHHLG